MANTSRTKRWTRRLTIVLAPAWGILAATAVIHGWAFMAAFAGFLCGMNLMQIPRR